MSRQSRQLGLGMLGAALLSLAGASACAAQRPSSLASQIDCSTSGAKLFDPAMTAQAICDRFEAALRSRPLPAGPLTVELQFAGNGIASASVSVARDGQDPARSRVELAVSDRGFAERDLDGLAADVAAGLSERSGR